MDNNLILERAVSAVEAHKTEYYKDGVYRKADFWDYAEIFEIIEDLYEVTGDKKYFAQFSEMYDYIIEKYTADWEDNPFNDDIMWLVIATARAYLYTGEEKYLALAKHNFDKTYARSVSDDLGGGLFWRIEKQCKNTCVNCPAAIAAGFLAKATGDDSYYDKLFVCLDWTVRMMMEENGKIKDSINMDGRVGPEDYTYNQGTFIGACTMYYEKTGDRTYLDYAEKTASYVKNVKYQNSIMDDEDFGNDQPGFKGIMSRYLRRLADVNGDTELRDWLRKNGEACWENRNKKGIMSTQLAHKLPDDADYDVFSASAAMGVIVNSADTKIKL